MPVYRIAFKPEHPKGTYWGIEDERGERRYTRNIICQVPSRYVTVEGSPRDHGYAEVVGVVQFDEAVSRIVPEVSDE